VSMVPSAMRVRRFSRLRRSAAMLTTSRKKVR
jgi:hypothetical protein